VTSYLDHHETAARTVKATWGQRCDILYFVSTKVEDSLPSIAVDIPEGRESQLHKTRSDNELRLFRGDFA
jgi:hypothetical protein